MRSSLLMVEQPPQPRPKRLEAVAAVEGLGRSDRREGLPRQADLKPADPAGSRLGCDRLDQLRPDAATAPNLIDPEVLDSRVNAGNVYRSLPARGENADDLPVGFRDQHRPALRVV